MDKIAYKADDIQRIVMLLNSVKVVGIDSCQIVADVANVLQNTGELVKESDEDDTGDTAVQTEI